MKKVVIIRYCEIHLKGKNKGYFERLLGDNIKHALKDLDFKYVKIPARYLIEDFSEDDLDEIVSRLQKVSGIHSISVAILVPSEKEIIYQTALDLCKDKVGTFKVDTNRADKRFPVHSVDLSRELGGLILSKYAKNLSVKIKNPDFCVNIDIRESGDTLIFTDVIKCMGGIQSLFRFFVKWFVWQNDSK